MTRITPDQIHSLYASLYPESGQNVQHIKGYLRLQRLEADKLTDKKKLTDEQLKEFFLKYSSVSDKFTNELIKQDIEELFSDKNQVSGLRQMLIENKGDVDHILFGYRKLVRVRRIEREIKDLENEINNIKLRLYCGNKSLQTANRAVISRVQQLQKKIQKKQEEKENLLRTKEVVAAYEIQKIAGYADRLNKGQLVYTTSVLAQKDQVRDLILTGQNILLTGPVGTGKTRLAIDIFREILEEKRKGLMAEIDNMKQRKIDELPERLKKIEKHKQEKGEEYNHDKELKDRLDRIEHADQKMKNCVDEMYNKLSQLCIVNGNEDSSIRELKSKPIQMSNKEGEENVFTYDEGLLTLCLKYGMPLIIDEANRTSPNFLSSLKKFWALKAGQIYKDEVTGEMFEIKAPLQVILTANEGQKYSKYTTEFQDQIERELERVHIGYMPANELFDLAKAKLYETPGIANVTEQDLQETLPHFISAVTEVNELYVSGKGLKDDGSTNDMKLSSTVFDTKRFLELIDREIIGTESTFWDELNQKIVKFIQGIKPSDAGDMDRKVLCNIFHKNGLLCKENIPDLVKGADKLTASDLDTIVSSSKTKLKIPKGKRFVNPWQFAKGYGKLINREGGSDGHRLASFEGLDFDEKGTDFKDIAKSLRGLNILNAIENSDLITKLKDINENNIEEILVGVGRIIVHERRFSDKLGEFNKIKEKANEVVPGISNRVQTEIMNDAETDSMLNNAEELELGEIPQDLKDFRNAWDERINNIDDGSKEKIIEAAENIPVKVETENDGSRLIEFELGNKRYKILDSKLKTHSDDEYFDNSEYVFIRKRNEWVKLGGMWGDNVDMWENKKLAEYVKEKEGEGLHIPKIEEIKELLKNLGVEAGLDEESDQIAMLMYLTGMDGWYWLSMGGDKKSGDQNMCYRLECDEDGRCRYFTYAYYDSSYSSLCMIAC